MRVSSEIADLRNQSATPFKIRASGMRPIRSAHPGISLTYREQCAHPASAKTSRPNPGDCRHRRKPAITRTCFNLSTDVLDLLHLKRGPKTVALPYPSSASRRLRRSKPRARRPRTGLKGLTKEGTAIRVLARAETAFRPSSAAGCRRNGGVAEESCGRVSAGRVRQRRSIRRCAAQPRHRHPATGSDLVLQFTMYKLVERILGQGETNRRAAFGRHSSGSRLVARKAAVLPVYFHRIKCTTSHCGTAPLRRPELNGTVFFAGRWSSLPDGRKLRFTTPWSRGNPARVGEAGADRTAEQRALPHPQLGTFAAIHSHERKPTAGKTRSMAMGHGKRGWRLPIRSQQGSREATASRASRTRTSSVSDKSEPSKVSPCSPASSAISVLTDPWTSRTTALRSSTLSWRLCTRRSIRTKRR